MPFGNSIKQKLYIVWMNMHKRCKDAKHHCHYRYGGRGITICEEWQEVEPFRKWALANGYKVGLTLDRIDNDSGYRPENCRFVTYTENNRNRPRKPDGSMYKEGRQFVVRVSIDGKRKYLGRFQTKEQAEACLSAFRNK